LFPFKKLDLKFVQYLKFSIFFKNAKPIETIKKTKKEKKQKKMIFRPAQHRRLGVRHPVGADQVGGEVLLGDLANPIIHSLACSNTVGPRGRVMGRLINGRFFPFCFFYFHSIMLVFLDSIGFHGF
jgi:hypothetical protein